MLKRALFALLLAIAPGIASAQTVIPRGGGGSGAGSFSATPFAATGGTTARTPAARAADQSNILDYGGDRTGATDSSTAWQAVITAACAGSPATIFLPGGTYDIVTPALVPSTCKNVSVYANPGTVTIIADATNAAASSNGLLLRNGASGGGSNISITGIIFDGNSANITTASPLVQFNAPADHIVFDNDTFQNARGDGVALSGSANTTTATTSVTFVPPGATLTFASVPAGCAVGSYVYGRNIPLNDTIASETGTTITFTTTLPAHIANGTAIHCSPVFATSADAPAGSSSLSLTSYTGLAANFVVSPTANGCIPAFEQIASTNAGAGPLTLTEPLQCDVPSASVVSILGGIQYSGTRNSTFSNIGQHFRTSGTFTGVTSGSTASGTNTVVLSSSLGLWPGNTTGASPPAGIPANDPVTAVNNGTNTITLQNPTTGIVATTTSIPFISFGPQSDAAFAFWLGTGFEWANFSNFSTGSQFNNIGLTSIAAFNQRAFIADGNRCNLGFLGYVSPASYTGVACVVSYYSKGTMITNNYAEGATGNAYDLGFGSSDFVVRGNIALRAGAGGVALCAQQGAVVEGNTVLNAGQAMNWPTSPLEAGGIDVSSCEQNQVGTNANIIIANNRIEDNQTSPTMQYGISQGSSTTNTNLRIPSGSNSIIGAAVASLSTGATNYGVVSPTPSSVNNSALLTTSGNWTVPAGVTQAIVTACGGGGGGGGITAVAGTAAGGMAGPCVTFLANGLTPGTSMAYTIGTGGSGGATTGAAGGAGTSTVFDGVTVLGGFGGLGRTTAGDAVVLSPKSVNSQIPNIAPTANITILNTSILGDVAGSTNTGGNGAACQFGAATAGTSNATGANATGYCAGGPGAGSTGTTAFAGGNGSPGVIQLNYSAP